MSTVVPGDLTPVESGSCEAWTIHLYESFFFGCIPVILSDFLAVPFQGIVDWTAFSIKWPEEEVGEKLLQHLRSIPLAKIAEMKDRLEEAACFFDFHRGYGLRERKESESSEWIKWKDNQVALGVDCPYVGHGNSETLEACHQSCKQSSCNLVNYDGSRADCVLRQCSDPAQPALTGGARGWQVWSMVNDTQLQCSPYHAVFRQLKQRHQKRPFSHGSVPYVPYVPYVKLM
eukprot:Skav223007  [mRNA]  locus=scaffold1422:13770:14902:+ [translate_table: standard]